MRLFVGVPLPEEVRHRLAALGAGLPGARWVAVDNLHVTLRFIGEVDDALVEDIEFALAAVRHPGFELALSGVGCFQSGRRVRVLWAGIDACQPLVHLRDRVESVLVRAGLEPEHRKFSAHVTLARFKNTKGAAVVDFLESHDGFAAGPFPAPGFTLFRSHMSPNGVRYQPLAEYPLDGEG